jgi:hypothetical protein
MIKRYEHTQKSYLTIIVIAAAMVFMGIVLAITGFNWIVIAVDIAVLIILVVVLMQFSSLTVTIWEDKLEVRFGPGLFREYFNLGDIASSRIVKNPWYYGWGIRITPQGQLYNVSGFFAVEITLKTSSRVRIGTDVPDELKAAIDQAHPEQPKF